MARSRRHRLPHFLSPRRLALGLCLAGLGLAAAGPAAAQPAAVPGRGVPYAVAPQGNGTTATGPAAGEVLPAPTPAAAEATPAKKLPVSLDTIFRLAQDQNTQVRLARERVRGACADLDVAQLGWLPRLYVGPAYYRHEGGIQNEDGTLTHSSMGALFAGTEIDGQLDLREYAYQKVRAEREVWQQKGELSRINYETLQDASDTYIDLLRARSDEALAQSQLDKQEDLIRFVAGLKDPGYEGELDMLHADREGYRQLVLRARQQQQAYSAHLVYLLGLDPCTELIPVDDRLQAFNLIDAAVPVCDLVVRAVSFGPGVRELEGMLNLLTTSLTKAQGPSRLLPVFEMRMAEGAFGAGPGDDARWDNRWDLALQARWDLGSLVTGRARQRSGESKLQQVNLNLLDLRGKLTAGVQEAREATLSTHEQIGVAQKRLEYSQNAYNLHSKIRTEPEDKRAILRELIQNVRSLREAERDVLDTVAGYDKAQLRLILLLGPSAPPPSGAGACH
jgi:outer membrane protein TolC